MGPSAFEEYDGYAQQRAAVVEGGTGWSASYEGDFALGFVLRNGAVDPDAARMKLMEAVRPCDLVVEDSRREHDWGASGPVVFDLMIGIAGSMSATVVLWAIKDLLAMVKRSEEFPEGIVDLSAEEVSTTFGEFVSSALRGRNVRTDEVERRGDYWYVAGRCSRGRVEGLVDAAGEIIQARLMKKGQEPLAWPSADD